MTTNANDAAFADSGWSQSQDVYVEIQPGLTKREYFAAIAMQGIMASDTSHEVLNPNAASWAVDLADALIEALNRETK